jgi:hypothetical protein
MIVDQARSVIARGAISEEPVRLFKIKSGEKLYRVLVTERPGETSAIDCIDCPAGQHGVKCYHACAVLMTLREEDPRQVVDETTIRAIIKELDGKGYRDPVGRNATVHLALAYFGAEEGEEVARDLDDLPVAGTLYSNPERR